MRRGEVLGLRWKDLDLDQGRLSIRQTVTLVDHKIVTANRTKTGKGRAVDLDPTTIAELRAHRVKQAQELLLFGIRQDGDTLIFCHPDGRPYNPERFSREFARALDRRPDLPRIRLHDLRHSWATLALASGVPVKIVGERLGHTTTAITSDVYSHVTPTMGADAAERVSALIFGGRLS
jgi:integrase